MYAAAVRQWYKTDIAKLLLEEQGSSATTCLVTTLASCLTYKDKWFNISDNELVCGI